MTSEVYNPETRAREIFLTVIFPEPAFISRFAIELGGQLFVAEVREKENAWREYQEAVSQGKTAGTYIYTKRGWLLGNMLKITMVVSPIYLFTSSRKEDKHLDSF